MAAVSCRKIIIRRKFAGKIIQLQKIHLRRRGIRREEANKT
jgi:hypothetical protein